MTRPRSNVLLLCLALAASTHAQPAPDSDSPAAELATFKIADGFDISLFASEADGVVKPIQLRFDARGRLWVIGSTVYPQLEPGQVPDDKVVFLEDSNSDGKSDKTTVFERGLTIPTGIEIEGDSKGIYLGHGTQLLHLRDTDDDGKADERTVVFRGFGTGDSHQNINSFLWGPGGELWMCQGLSIRSRVETPWGIVGMNQAGVWRVYPRRQKLQAFFGSAFEPQNPWGVIFTDWGEPLIMAGNNSSPIYPVPGMIERHQNLAPPLIWKNGKGRKVGGGDIVGTSLFPPDWQGALIVGGYINNAVWALNVKDDGSGFSIEDREPLITSTSQSFRPVDAKFGPDGALYIADWYNPIIGHYQASLRDPRRDKAHGRIWRVTAKGRDLTPTPNLANAGIPDLLETLKSKDRWTRSFGKRVLSSRPREEVAEAVQSWAAQPGVSDSSLKDAIGVLQSVEVVNAALVERLSKSKLRSARAYAANVIGQWADRLPDALALLRPLAADSDARVRLHAIVACTYVDKPEAIEVAMIATDSDRDRFIDYAIKQAVYALKPQWVGPFTEGKLTFEGKTSRVVALVRADGTPDTLAAVRSLVKSPTADAPTREGFYRILANVGDASDLDAIVLLEHSDPAMLGRLLPAVAEAGTLRNVRPNARAMSQVHSMLRSTNENAVGALSLAAAWRMTDWKPEVTKLTYETGVSIESVQVAAIRALPSVGNGADVRDRLLDLAMRGGSASARAAAIASLAEIDVPAASKQAAAFLARSFPDEVVAELFQSLLARDDAAQELASAMMSSTPTPDAAKIGLRVMSATGRRDESLAKRLAEHAGLNQGPRKVADMAAFTAEVSKNGDALNGRDVFARAEAGCVACHAVGGNGGTIGPDLGAIGTAHPIDFIATAILDPNREVREGYIAHEIRTKAGQTYQGYIVSETPQELVFRDTARNNAEVRLRADTIKSKTQRGSVMPPGLADTMTDSEFRDLVKYLSELGRDVK